MSKVINILGQDIRIEYKTELEDHFLVGVNGYYDKVANKIVIDKKISKWDKNNSIRHEVIHAFLYEAGYQELCSNENFVNLLALKFPYLYKLFRDLKVHI